MFTKKTINCEPLSGWIFNPIGINTECYFPISRELKMPRTKSDVEPEIAHYLAGVINAVKLLGTTMVCTLPFLMPSLIFSIACACMNAIEL